MGAPKWTKPVMLVAGTINVLAGLGMVFAPSAVAEMTKSVVASPINPTYWAGLLVATFGIGYYMAAFNPKQHWGIILLGAIGKFLVVLEGLVSVAQGTAANVQGAFMPVIADGPFVLLFLLILLRIRKGG